MSGPSAPGTGDATTERHRSVRSEAFVWLTVLGLFLLWLTLPVVLALSGWFDCLSSDRSCREAVERKDLASTIAVALLVGFTGLAIGSDPRGAGRLPDPARPVSRGCPSRPPLPGCPGRPLALVAGRSVADDPGHGDDRDRIGAAGRWYDSTG